MINMTDEEMIVAYVVEELSTSSLGRLTGVSPSTIYDRLKTLGVAMRGRGEFTPKQSEIQRVKAQDAWRENNGAYEHGDERFVRRVLAAGGYQNAHIAERNSAVGRPMSHAGRTSSTVGSPL